MDAVLGASVSELKNWWRRDGSWRMIDPLNGPELRASDARPGP
jgi:hypothetical protein